MGSGSHKNECRHDQVPEYGSSRLDPDRNRALRVREAAFGAFAHDLFGLRGGARVDEKTGVAVGGISGPADRHLTIRLGGRMG